LLGQLKAACSSSRITLVLLVSRGIEAKRSKHIATSSYLDQTYGSHQNTNAVAENAIGDISVLAVKLSGMKENKTRKTAETPNPT
jgi:hypothetical protein